MNPEVQQTLLSLDQSFPDSMRGYVRQHAGRLESACLLLALASGPALLAQDRKEIPWNQIAVCGELKLEARITPGDTTQIELRTTNPLTEDIAIAFDLDIVATDGKIDKCPLGIGRLAAEAVYDQWEHKPFRGEKASLEKIVVGNIRWIPINKLHKEGDDPGTYRNLADAVTDGTATVCQEGGELSIKSKFPKWKNVDGLRWIPQQQFGDEFSHHYELKVTKGDSSIALQYGLKFLEDRSWSEEKNYQNLNTYTIPLSALAECSFTIVPAQWGNKNIKTGEHGKGEQQLVTIKSSSKCIDHSIYEAKQDDTVKVGEGKDDLVFFEVPDKKSAEDLVRMMQGLVQGRGEILELSGEPKKDGESPSEAQPGWQDIEKLRWISQKKVNGGLFYPNHELNVIKHDNFIELQHGYKYLFDSTWEDDAPFKSLDEYEIPLEALGNCSIIVEQCEPNGKPLKTGDDGKEVQYLVTIKLDEKSVKHKLSVEQYDDTIKVSEWEDNLVLFEVPSKKAAEDLVTMIQKVVQGKGKIVVSDSDDAETAIEAQWLTQKVLKEFLDYACDVVQRLPAPVKSRVGSEYEDFYENRGQGMLKLIAHIDKCSGIELRRWTERLISHPLTDLDLAITILDRDMNDKIKSIENCRDTEPRLADLWTEELQAMRRCRNQVKSINDKVQQRLEELGIKVNHK